MNMKLGHTSVLALLSVALFAVSFASCRQKMQATSYFNHFNSFQEGSYVEVENNNIVYQLQKRPKEFQALNALKGTGQIEEATVNPQIDSFGDDNLYCLRIKLKKGNEDLLRYNLSEENEYYQRVELLSAQFGTMTYGVTNNRDTVYTGFHHFERAYQMRPFIQVLFSLSNKEGGNPDQIVFDDFVFNQGEAIVFDQLINYNKQLPKLAI